MKILSIETSCDDTDISIMEVTSKMKDAAFKILSHVSNSQINIHRPFGGVYPVMAKREHAKNLPIVLAQVLKEVASPRLLKRIHPSPLKINGEGAGGEGKPPVDLIAVTYGPGLEMCLWEGIIFAKELAKKWKVPVIPVNHMEGHILSVLATGKKFSIPNLQFPILALLVSGGHTQLILSKKLMQYEIIGETLDDAVGEAYDKVARMLELPYPGGPEISRLAEELRGKENQREGKFSRERSLGRSDGDGQRKFSAENFRAESTREFSFALPRPMLHSKNLNFSFSGLKTAVLYFIKDLGDIEKISEEKKAQIALEFENAAIECLTHKTKKAMEKYKIKTLIVAGGVAANKHLRREIKLTAKSYKLKAKNILFPTPELSGDNSIMIGIAGYLNYIKNKKKVPKPETIKADGNLRLS